jgi:hypothetical protein
VPEITNSDIPVPIEHDIARTQIAMNNTASVEIAHPKDNSDNNSRNSIGTQEPPFASRKMTRQ